MLKISKIYEGEYSIHFIEPVEVVDKTSGFQLKKEIGRMLKDHRVFRIDLKGVQNVDKNGYKMIGELLVLAAGRSCKIYFENSNPLLQNKLDTLKVTS